MIESGPQRRLLILFIAFPGVLLCLFFRLSYVQFFHPLDLGMRALEQHRLVIQIPPYRGKIIDRNGGDLALDIQLDSLGAHSRDVKDKDALAKKLQTILGLEHKFIRERLSRDKDFVWIARKITRSQSEALRKLNRTELELRHEWKRHYPNGPDAGNVIGFTGMDHKGLEGVEYMFDSYLRGVPGWKMTQKDAKQRELVAKESDWAMPVDGYNLHLTIDMVVQRLAEKALSAVCKKYGAEGGSVVVMDPRSGELLALVNWPGYDPNSPGHFDRNLIRNRAITDIYEPGSVFKLITVSAALEEKVFALDDTIFCENGNWRTGGRVLHDVHGYGKLTVEDVISKSSNIGTVKMAQKLGGSRLHETIKRFGFGEKSEILLAGESPGLITHPKNWSATSISSVPIGQEIGVTALQMAGAVAAIANGGVLMKPRIISAIRGESGEAVKEFPAHPRRRVLSAETAAQVRRVMRKVVEQGTGKQAAVPGAEAGGKTGTSQKLDANGAYSHSSFIASFVGYVKKDGRMAVISVMVDDPHPVYYGGVVAAPVFSEVGKGMLEYWQLAPVESPKSPPASAGRIRPAAKRQADAASKKPSKSR